MPVSLQLPPTLHDATNTKYAYRCSEVIPSARGACKSTRNGLPRIRIAFNGRPLAHEFMATVNDPPAFIVTVLGARALKCSRRR